ncbi:folate family ECF transporter S component [Halarsenatibacter silvermanii]|uniref:ECF transporter S component, folate family n=1 Tax=Halarsenatibacter silvermanii TaxID=321763 RepID=A0A1G9QB13_9FIRM|nr:folate family ECF transporter S component [Halarsenatibacter silvermanii]SDM08149.1 ECF transporter S component, folate family [Halarsenatibacter silvermanii]
MKISTHRLVYAALLIALSIIFTRIFSLRIALGGAEGIRIGLGGLPIVFAGIAFGPLVGGIVGAVSDLIGFFINPMGPYMPHFTLTSFLTGFMPGIFICYFFAGRKSFRNILITIAITQVITAVLMVPYFQNSLFGIPYIATVPSRVISQAGMIPLYAYLSRMLLRYNLIKIPEHCRPASG